MTLEITLNRKTNPRVWFGCFAAKLLLVIADERYEATPENIFSRMWSEGLGAGSYSQEDVKVALTFLNSEGYAVIEEFTGATHKTPVYSLTRKGNFQLGILLMQGIPGVTIRT